MDFLHGLVHVCTCIGACASVCVCVRAPISRGKGNGKSFPAPEDTWTAQAGERLATKYRDRLSEKLLRFTLGGLGAWPLVLQFPQGLLQNLRTSKTLSRNRHPSKPALSGCRCRRSPGREGRPAPQCHTPGRAAQGSAVSPLAAQPPPS